MLYFAFGSNMNPDRMRQREVNFTSRVGAILKGYTLKFNKVAANNPRKGFANIVPDQNGTVEGVLYEITKEGIRILDGYEVGYERIRLPVETADNGVVEAETFVAEPEWVKDGLKPDRVYLNHLLAGEDLLSESYYRKLAETDTLD